jgi:hypothetical protein
MINFILVEAMLSRISLRSSGLRKLHRKIKARPSIPAGLELRGAL